MPLISQGMLCPSAYLHSQVSINSVMLFFKQFFCFIFHSVILLCGAKGYFKVKGDLLGKPLVFIRYGPVENRTRVSSLRTKRPATELQALNNSRISPFKNLLKSPEKPYCHQGNQNKKYQHIGYFEPLHGFFL